MIACWSKVGTRHREDTHENLLAIVVPAIADALKIVRRGLVFCAGTKIGAFPEPDAIGGVYCRLDAGARRGFTGLALCMLYGQAPALEKGAKPTVPEAPREPTRMVIRA